jgi:hypothetical protein
MNSSSSTWLDIIRKRLSEILGIPEEQLIVSMEFTARRENKPEESLKLEILSLPKGKTN